MIRSWKENSSSVNILRVWLGVTWIFAGWNKATDAGFLDPASAHYIGAQLTGYVASSPIGFILKHMVEHATLIGWSVMIGEFAIGIAILAGVAMQLASIAGAGMTLVLWLSATWSVKPYFLGSDTAYLVMWIALFLALRTSARGLRRNALIPNFRDRRETLRMGAVGALAIAGGFLGKAFVNASPTPEMGSAITTLDALAIGQTLKFKAADGTPAVLFRTKAGVFAYSRVCTHQGCIVDYDAASHLLACPCHGAQFDPTAAGKAVAGPTQVALPKINVAVKGNNIVQI